MVFVSFRFIDALRVVISHIDDGIKSVFWMDFKIFLQLLGACDVVWTLRFVLPSSPTFPNEIQPQTESGLVCWQLLVEG